MNLVDAVVTRIIGEPYTQYGKWFVKAEINAYGRVSEHIIMADTQKGIKAYSVGDRVLV